MRTLRDQGFRSGTTNSQERRPRKVMREFQRAHEPLSDVTKRLARKYGREQLLATVHHVYEETGGINYESVTKDLPVKFVSLTQAADELGVPHSTLVNWVVNGWLQNVGKWEHA